MRLDLHCVSVFEWLLLVLSSGVLHRHEVNNLLERKQKK